MQNSPAETLKSPIKFLFQTLRQNVSSFIADRRTIEFPGSATVMKWLSGTLTVLPWVKNYKDLGVSFLTSLNAASI
jgi:hypothetical protein